MIEFKLFYFILYAIAVFLFYQYINLFYYINYSIDYLFNNVNNHSTYDYIIGMLNYFNNFIQKSLKI